MKVLFAIGKSQLSKNIADRYYDKFGETLEYKDVFYFKALLDEVKRDKTYNVIVINEELEQYKTNDIEQLDRKLFSYVDNITDEAQDAEIIYICSERRTKDDQFIVRLYSIGIYNILLGDDRNVNPLCEIIKKPKTKKEAKEYLNIDTMDLNETGIMRDDEVDETQMMNIFNYYERIKNEPEKYVETFDRISTQYNRAQLKVIASLLPKNVQEVIYNEPKYKFLLLYDSNENPNVTMENKVVSNVRKIEKKHSPNFFGVFKKNTEKIIQNINQKTEKIQQDREEKTELKRQQELAEKAKKEAELKEQQELAEKAKKEAELKEQQELAEKAKKEAELKEQQELAEKAKKEAELKTKQLEEQIIVEVALEEKKDIEEKQSIPELNQIQEQNVEVKKEEAPKKPTSSYIVNASPKVDMSEEQKRIRQEQEKLALEQEKIRKVQAELEEEKRKLREEQERLVKEKNQLEVKVPAENKITYEVATVTPLNHKKIVAFVGANKAGTTFMVNAVAHNLSNQKILTSILDMTRDKSMYYIYNQDDRALRKMAGECMQKLSDGVDSYLPISKYLKVYTTIPGGISDSRRSYKHKTIIETAKTNNNITIVDADFTTPIDYFEAASEIYVVQDMDILKMQETTMFLREMKNRNVDMSKIRVIVNKYVKNILTPKKIIEGLSYYKDPEMTFIDTLLSNKIMYSTIPYNLNNYVKYTESLCKGTMSFKNYSVDFTEAIDEVVNHIYPKDGLVKRSRGGLFG